MPCLLDFAGSTAYDQTSLTTPSGCNSPPTPIVSATSYSLPCNGIVTLDGSASTDPDAGDAVAVWAWQIYSKAGVLVHSNYGSSIQVTNTQLAAGATYDVSCTSLDITVDWL